MNKDTQELYTSPEVKVVEIKVRQIICQSNTERPGNETPGWGWVSE